MQCPKCRYKTMFDFVICPKCGYDLNAEHNANDQFAKNNSEKSSNNFNISNIYMVLIAIIALIISALSGASFFGTTLTILIIWIVVIAIIKTVNLIKKPPHMGRLKRVTTKEGDIYFVDAKTGERIKTELDVRKSDIIPGNIGENNMI